MPRATRTFGESRVFTCSCPREACKNEMKVSPALIGRERSVMLMVAMPHEWGTSNVRTVALTREQRAELLVLLADADWWGDFEAEGVTDA